MISCRCPCSRVQVAQRDQRLDALAPGLADADQDAARVRDPQPPGAGDRIDAHRRQLVGRAEVRAAALREPLRGRLEHDPLRRADLAQREQLVVVEDARVRVGQQARLAQHLARHVGEVGGGRREAEARELLARGAVAQLGLVAEREERLAAARPRRPGARSRRPRRPSGTRARPASAAARTCSSGTRRGTAS